MAWEITGNSGTNPNAPVNNFLGTTDNNALAIRTNNAERIRIDTSGNVGIGTSSPGSKLVISDGSNGASLHPGGIGFNRNVADGQIYNSGISAWQFSARDAYFALEGYNGAQFNSWAVTKGGNVGIGTPSPGSKLVIREGTDGVSLHAAGAASGIGFNRNVSDGAIYNSGISAWQFSARDAYFALEGYNGAQFNSWAVTKGGNVGIGTTAPASRLHVSGDVTVTGDVLLTGADCAEQFDTIGTQLPEPGTVVVIDEAGALRESREAYDKKVAGVISGAGSCRPGLVLDNRPSEEPRATLALVGKAYCKVDARGSSIEVGDLLTTSSTPGHAMKAADPAKAFGCVIGKALKALKEGQALIPILIALQ